METPSIDAVVKLGELHKQSCLVDLFPTGGAIAWEWRKYRAQYIAGGAVFEIAGRFVAHPPSFRRVALELGAKRIAHRFDKGP